MAEKYHAKHHIKTAAPKALAIALAAVIGVGGAGAAAVAYAQSAKSAPVQKVTDALKSHTADSDKKTENTKTETVYVIANADGTVKKVLVSDWIQNALGSATVNDRSELGDVSVVKGDTTYTMNGDDLRVWDAQGGDVYTQGTIEKELPVNLAVSYQLDGKPISAEELAGKSGRVTIRFDYANNQYETRTVNGKSEKIYVPFVMLTGLLLDNDSFSNIEISNGKLVNDGSRTVAIGFAMPGLQENLGIDRSDLELPDYVEVSADVTNFSLATTMTFATNDLFNQVDVDEMNGADDLKDAMAQLTDAMKQLTDGSSQLYDGLSTLLDKSGTLISGINTLTDGAKALRDGAAQAADGATTLKGYTAQLASGAVSAAGGAQQLQAGIDEYAAQLNGALSQMTNGVGDVQDGLSQVLAGFEKLQGENGANSKALVAAAEQVYDQLLNTAVTQLRSAGLEVPDVDHTEAATLTATLDALTAKPYTQLTTLVTQAAVKKTITEQVLAAMQKMGLQTAEGKAMTADQYEAAKSSAMLPAATTQQVDALIAAKLADEATVKAVTQAIAQNPQAQATISAAVTQYVTTLSTVNAQLKAYDEFYTGLQDYTAGVAEAADGTQQIADGADTLHNAMTDGASQLAGGTQQLRDGASQLANGTGSLASGAGQLDSGMGTLVSGLASVQDGASQLFNGLLTLQSGSGALVDGVQQLRDGAMQLNDGLKQFNDDGIAKLDKLVNGDLDDLIARLKATADVSKNYRSFTGLSDDMDGKVSFIYKTAEIEANK